MKSSLSALTDTAKSQKSVLTRVAKKQGLTIAEWQLLLKLLADFTTQESLSAATQLDTSTLSRQLSSLVKKAMIAKTAVGHDRRQLVYSVTEQGQAAAAAVNQAYDAFEQEVFDRWPQDEQNLLQILLNRLNKSLDRASESFQASQK